MFTIYVYTHDSQKKEYSMVDKEYAISYFRAFLQAIDVKTVVMLDGLTGEVLYEWRHSHFTIFNSQMIGEEYMR